MQTNCIFGGYAAATSTEKQPKISSLQALAIVCLVLLALSTAIGYLSYSAITNANTALNDLKSNYQNLTQQYARLQSNYSSLQQSTNNLQQNLSQLQSTYLSSQEDFNLLRTQITQLKALFNTSQTLQSTLQTQFSNLQANYTSLQSANQALGNASSFSYLVFTDGNGTTYAENGTTKALDFSGPSASSVAQACIDALHNSGGKIIFAGKISLDNPLTVLDGETAGLLELSGLGPSTQLVSGNGNDCIDILGGQPFGYGGPYHMVISDMVLTSETSPQGKLMNIGIYVNDWFGVDVENVMVFYAAKAGILVQDSADVHLNNVYVEGCSGVEYGGTQPLTGVGFWLSGSKDCYLNQCFSDTNQIGFLLDSNPQTNNVPRNTFLSLCEATLSGLQGISIADAHGIVLSNSLLEGSNSEGALIVDSFDVSILDSMINGNAGNGIVVTNQNASMYQSEISIKDCLIDSNNGNGVGIWAKDRYPISQVIIDGCTVTNSGASARQNPNQVDISDAVNISNDASTGGNCTYITIQNCFLGNAAGTYATQKFGVRTLQSSDYVQVVNNAFFGNMAGNYTLAGTHNTIANNRDQ